MLFYPDFPFFHLCVQSSSNKACLCFAGTIPSIPPRPGRSLESNTWQSHLLHSDLHNVKYNMPSENKRYSVSWALVHKHTLIRMLKQCNLSFAIRLSVGITWHLAGHGYPSNYSSRCSTFSSAFPCLPQGAQENILGASVIPWKEIKGKQTICNAWISGACITVSLASSRPGLCQLDLKWSRSEATARSCGFPLTLMPGVMPWGPCIIICFPCHLIVLASGFYMLVCIFFHIAVPAGSV